MTDKLSPRLRQVVDALPLEPGMRVLEIGGAPGAAARAVADIIGPRGHIMVIDRSPRGIALTSAACVSEIAVDVLSVLQARVEDFVLPPGTGLFDLAFACRVGALDGRHPHLCQPAVASITKALTPSGRLFVDTGDPLRELELSC
ncbi:methyltransferase domain-containing protein [Microbacterium sp. P01]|uniref:methyltransferase domain-containing protein n=1 Tax=Microbacterium sp. P01 TaxID=3366261 RepID=UPI00367162A1